ncbi:hypothetical protein CCACVL1_26676 [Corchorus capsularis]|uniref:Uncharacterized protein n=1 Tax=Corchorus capsularis TaxID=210143 RepID=A0A1R3GDW4_COCAP|nr:hypothetical protein CCACVL1_26676 [Corchorus capsularis]
MAINIQKFPFPLLFLLNHETDIVVTVNLGKSGEYLLEGKFDCIHEITSALALSRMSDSAYRVETTARLAQWRIDNLASCTYCKSDPFNIDNWNCELSGGAATASP